MTTNTASKKEGRVGHASESIVSLMSRSQVVGKGLLDSSTKAVTSTLPINRNKQAALQALAEDVLRSQDVFIKLRSHVGFPSDVDALAYDARSKLLLVSSHGMVKAIGSDGVESIVLRYDVEEDGGVTGNVPQSPFVRAGSALSPSPSSTRERESSSFRARTTAYLGFVEHSVIHVSTAGRVRLCRLDGGDVQELSLGGRRPVHVRDVTMIGSQYLVVGCDVEGANYENSHIHNCCRVVRVRAATSATEASGLAASAGSVETLEATPYKIFADQDLEASGRLLCLESTVLADQGRPLLLFVYRDSGALVYDVRAERVLCCAGADECAPSVAKRRVPTCACWLGDAGNCFAIGYEDGSVTVWGVSASIIRANPMKATASNTREDAVRIMDIDVAEGAQLGPIRSVAYLAGGPGTPHGKECLLVLGGQRAGQPDMLVMASLEPAGWSREDIVTIPWFGDIISYSLMREENKIMILTEGGQLVVHDLGTWEPLPVSLKFQELPLITCASFLPSVHASGTHVPSLKNLRFLSWKHVEDCKWPFSGGVPPLNYFVSEADYLTGATSTKKYTTHPSGVLLFGHRDGRVRVWDATSEVPKHMTTVPADPKVTADEGRLMPVACLDACPLSGLLAVGHDGGIVRVYQFSTTLQSVRKVSLEGSTAMPYDTQIDQNPGWQYVLTHALHEGRRITAVRISSSERAMAVGDDSGRVSIVDLDGPTIKLEHSVGVDARASAPSPASSASSTLQASVIVDIRFAALETGECAVFCLRKDGTLEVLDYKAGGRPLLPKSLRPKNDSSTLHMALLDTEGSVLSALSESIELSWADNSAVERPRTMGMTKLIGSNFSHGRALGRDFDADAVSDAESEDSEFGDINTAADLWGSAAGGRSGSGSAAPSPSTATGSATTTTYPNESFYATYIKTASRNVCNYVLVASVDSLRLYCLESVLKGDRSPLKKVRFGDAGALLCGSFHSVSGSGVLVTTRDAVRCFTLPGLEEVGRAERSDGTHECGGVRAGAVSLDGLLVMTSSTNEIVRYSSLVRSPLPASPERLVEYGRPGARADSVGMAFKGAAEGSSRNVALQSLNSVFGSVKGAATAATGLVVQEIEKIGGGSGGARELPALVHVFEKTTSHLDEEIGPQEDEALVEGALSEPGPKLSTPLQQRTELLGPRSQSARKPARRTVSSVKREYQGSRGQVSTDGVRSVVEDTRRALAERGEKLGRLEEKADDLNNEAEDFASMAKELEAAFDSKRWF